MADQQAIRPGGMFVSVKGLKGATHSHGVDPSATVDDLKNWVAQMDGVAAEKIVLCTAQGMELVKLDHSKALYELSLSPETALFARRRQHAAWGEYATAWQQLPPAFLRPAPAIEAN
uniref:Ubiquitin-like domain-containing protein n=1 Tax=Alexandrium catenella TaxID=2925 RepID=A0A7S1RRN6_ALECA|mmetsp:Transcript_70423/g.187199  ORF Transcript_70423/g.187199 Transcript_70423/m.187199 type:complete len:117 (+) Transcript_70423:67-417(+)